MKWAILFGYPKCCFFLHYNSSSLGHFLGRSIWVCQFACVSRAFRRTLTMGSPLVLWFQNTSTFLMYVFSTVLFTFFFSPVPCDPYYKLLPVFHAFPPTLIHPFVPLTSSRDFLPLSYAFTLGSQSISSSITLCVRGFVSCNFFVHAMGFPCVPVFQVAIVDPHHNGHIGDRGNWPL